MDARAIARRVRRGRPRASVRPRASGQRRDVHLPQRRLGIFQDLARAWYETSDVFAFIERATETLAPATVDSVGVAGLMDLLRCRGCWSLAARYAYLFGVDRGAVDFDVPEYATFERLGEALDACFRETVASAAKDASDFGLYTLAEDIEEEERSVSVREGAKQKHRPSGMLRPARHEPRHWPRPWIRSRPTAPRPPHERRERPRTLCTSAGRDRARRLRGGRRRVSRREEIKSAATRRLRSSDASLSESLDLGDRPTALETFVSAAVDGFFDNDLFHATRLFMANARGLVRSRRPRVRSFVPPDDRRRERQTNSVALYPRLGLVLYGSEQAAVKACVGMKPRPGPRRSTRPPPATKIPTGHAHRPR